MYRTDSLTESQIAEEAALLDLEAIQNILEEHSSTPISGKRTVKVLFNDMIETLQREYVSDEMPNDLAPFIKKILYVATMCEKHFGKRIIKSNIDIKKAKESGTMFYRLHTLCMSIADLPELL